MHSIENLPQPIPKNLRLTPRSQQGLKRSGYKLQDLQMPTNAEIIRKYGDNVTDPNIMKKRLEHEISKRNAKVKITKEFRQQVLNDQLEGHWSGIQVYQSVMQQGIISPKSVQSTMKSTVFEKEMKQLEKIKLKQQKQLQQTIHYETKQEEIRKNNDEKKRQQHEKEIRRQHLLAEKRKREDEIRRRREEELKRRQDQETHKKEKFFLENQRKQQQRKLIERARLLQREEESHKAQQARRLKHAELQKQKDSNSRAQQEKLLKKKSDLDRKANERTDFLNRLVEKRREQSELKKVQKEEKIKHFKYKNQQVLIQLKNRLEDRSKGIQLRRHEFEAQRKKSNEAMKAKSQIMNSRVKEMLENNQYREEKKKLEYCEKQKEAEQRKAEQSLEKEKELQLKKQAGKQKQDEKNRVRMDHQKKLLENQSYFRQRLHEKQENLSKIQHERDEQAIQRKNQDLMKRIDKRENVERILNQKQHEKQILLEKINLKALRAQQFQAEKDGILMQRQLAKKQIELQRWSMNQKLEKLKRGKLRPEELLKELSVDDHNSPNNISQNRSEVKLHKKRHVIGHTASNSNVLKTKTISQSPIMMMKSSSKTGKQNRESRYRVNSKEVKAKIDDVVEKQNSEMLKLLSTQQQASNTREKVFHEATGSDKKRLEKLQSVERDKCRSRIQRLNEMQNNQLKNLRRIYGVQE